MSKLAKFRTSTLPGEEKQKSKIYSKFLILVQLGSASNVQVRFKNCFAQMMQNIFLIILKLTFVDK